MTQYHKNLTLSKFIYATDILAKIVLKAIFVFKIVILSKMFCLGDNKVDIVFQDFIGYLYIFGSRGKPL